MKSIAFATAAVAVGMSFASVAQAQPAPLIKVLIAPGAMDEKVGKGEVKITMTAQAVDAPAGAPLFRVPVAEDLVVTDAQGVVPRASNPPPPAAKPDEERGPMAGPGAAGGRGQTFIPARPVKGDLTIAYRAPVQNGNNGGTTPINPRIDGEGFSALGSTLLPNLDTKTRYRIAIDWDLKAMAPGSTAVSSLGDGNAEMGAGPASRLGRTVMMAGKLYRDPVVPTGKFSAAWSGDPGFDMHPPMQYAAKLHSYMVKFFNTPNDPAYRVLLRLNAAGNPGGGVAFPNSFFATWGPTVSGESIQQILGHEMVHTFTANSLGKWYDEGDAVFYQVRLPWMAGMVPTETYLRDINLTAARYYTNAEINAREELLIPNFFKNPWMNTLGYDRGALYFAALDGMARRASGGKKTIDDLVRVLVKMQRSEQEITEQTWVDLLQKEIGANAVTLHKSMMAGGLVAPESSDFGPCFRRVDAKIRRFEQGFTVKTVEGKKIVDAVVEGSEAAKAGMKNGEEISQMPVITTEGVKRRPEQVITVVVLRDGQKVPVTYLPRTQATYAAYQWERVPGVADETCRKWAGA
jgi:predicted metalloprotease with PDZ domain